MIVLSMAISKSQVNAQKKQSSIVRAALKLFLQQGYAATSMDVIAERASVTKQTVYRYYPSKEALFAAVMAKIRADQPPAYQFKGGSPEQELNNFGRDLLVFHLTPSAIGIYKLMLSEGGDKALMQVFLQTGPNRVERMLTTFLQQSFPQLDEPAFYAEMFISMVLTPRNRLVIRDKERISRKQQEAHVRRVVKLFLKGLSVISVQGN